MMKIKFFYLLLLTSILSFTPAIISAQVSAPNGGFYDSTWKITRNMEQAKYYKLVEYLDSQKSRGIIRAFTMAGQKLSEEQYSDLATETLTGKSTSWYTNGNVEEEGEYVAGKKERRWKTYFENGQLQEEGDYIAGLKEGTWKSYYKNGQLKLQANYVNNKHNGELRSYYANGVLRRVEEFEDFNSLGGKCYSRQGKDTVFVPYSEMPEFAGGIPKFREFIKHNVTYPQAMVENNIQGTVYVQFIVGTDGSLSNINVIGGVAEDLDNEALRVVKLMPKWKPGKEEGELVPVYIKLPIKFSLK